MGDVGTGLTTVPVLRDCAREPRAFAASASGTLPKDGSAGRAELAPCAQRTLSCRHRRPGADFWGKPFNVRTALGTAGTRSLGRDPNAPLDAPTRGFPAGAAGRGSRGSL